MTGNNPYRAPAADVRPAAGVRHDPVRWRRAGVLLSALQAFMAMVWIWQDGGVLTMLRNGDMNFIAALPHMLSPLLLVLGATLLLARGRGATVAFAIAAALSALALWASGWRPLIAVTAVVIPVVGAAISFNSAKARPAR